MSQLNGHIPEHELLEFIEGTISPDRKAVVAMALARDPRLARLVIALQHDRHTLIGLGDVHAPAEIAERIESVLERQALLGLSDHSALAGPAALPVSRLRPARASIFTRAWRAPATRILAAAAGLALVAAGGFWAYTFVKKATAPLSPAGNFIASNAPDPQPAPPLIDDPAPIGATPEIAAAEPAPEPEPIAIAAAPDAGESLAATGAAIDTALTDAALAISTPVTPPSVPTSDPAADPNLITPARALELARRGRLAVLVETADTDGAIARVDAIAGGGASARSATWRRIDGGPGGGPIAPGYETVAALWSPNFAPANNLPSPGFPDSTSPQSPTTVAGDAPPTHTAPPALWPGLRLPLSLPAWAPPLEPPAAVYAVTLEDRQSTLTSLLAALRKEPSPGQPARSARFIELPVAIDPVPAAEPDAVLWWANPPSGWTWRLSVPVVIERGVP